MLSTKISPQQRRGVIPPDKPVPLAGRGPEVPFDLKYRETRTRRSLPVSGNEDRWTEDAQAGHDVGL
eukprot:1366005-Rhodomonas_salina.2